MTTQIIDSIRKDLTGQIDEHTRDTSRRFFKEAIQVYGVKGPVVEKIARDSFKQIECLSKQEIFDLTEPLWQSNLFEEQIIACNWIIMLHHQYEADDFVRFEHWLNGYVSNWAVCDTLCNHAIGDFLGMYPEYIGKLKTWAHSDNRWVRRAAAVSLILPARHGLFLQDVFDIADILLLDQDDLVQKGYGWMLKEASRQHQQDVFNYILAHKHEMPRTALRYAIEKMPADLKQAAMQRG